MSKKGERNKEEGEKGYLSRGTKTCLFTERTDVAHRQMAAYKGEKVNLMLK